jgi:hypothetical protein
MSTEDRLVLISFIVFIILAIAETMSTIKFERELPCIQSHVIHDEDDGDYSVCDKRK